MDDQEAQLRAQRDALEAELLGLEQTLQGLWQRGATAPADLLERVDALLRRLSQVNQALSGPAGTPSA